MNKTNKVLFIIPFESIYPPTSGGKQRCFHILHQLSIHFDLSVVLSINKIQIESAKRDYESLRNVSFTFIEENIEMPFFWKLFPKKLSYAFYYRFISRTLFKSSQSFLLKFYNPTLKLIETGNFDFVIHENIDSLDLARIIKRKFPELIQVYDAYNFDSELAEHQYSIGLLSKQSYTKVKLTEATLYKYIDILWTCSQRENELFSIANNGLLSNIDVIPNGAEITTLKTNNIVKERYELLFVGSLDYFPNEEGLLWFLKNVLPKIELEINLKVIGSGKSSIELNHLIKLKKNVELIGFVECLDDYYSFSDIVIIPIISGSGTRLKALEAMKFQKAIVSTSKGIQGIEIIDEVIIEDNPDVMAQVIAFTLQNELIKTELGVKARQLVQKEFDWNVIGIKIKKSLLR